MRNKGKNLPGDTGNGQRAFQLQGIDQRAPVTTQECCTEENAIDEQNVRGRGIFRHHSSFPHWPCHRYKTTSQMRPKLKLKPAHISGQVQAIPERSWTLEVVLRAERAEPPSPATTGVAILAMVAAISTTESERKGQQIYRENTTHVSSNSAKLRKKQSRGMQGSENYIADM